MKTMKSLKTFDLNSWDIPISSDTQNAATKALEEGFVLFFPNLPFTLSNSELQLLSPEKVDPKSKNISFDLKKDKLGGTLFQGNEQDMLRQLMKRYALNARHFMDKLIPHYKNHLIHAKTSLRPVEIYGRKSSYRKDDTLLHVDSFPSNPTKGKRILRLFTNINPYGKPRVWRVGEPFQDVINKFAPKVSAPIPGFAYFLQLLKITKDYRTAYDHYMLKIHNSMKGNAHYQKTVPQEEIHFPSGCSWMVYTDQVSHAAMSGQHVLEQTFHLPVEGLKNIATAPLKVLNKFFKKELV